MYCLSNKSTRSKQQQWMKVIVKQHNCNPFGCFLQKFWVIFLKWIMIMVGCCTSSLLTNYSLIKIWSDLKDAKFDSFQCWHLCEAKSRVEQDEKSLHFQNWVEHRSSISYCLFHSMYRFFFHCSLPFWCSRCSFSVAKEDDAAYHYAMYSVYAIHNETDIDFISKPRNALLMKGANLRGKLIVNNNFRH